MQRENRILTIRRIFLKVNRPAAVHNLLVLCARELIKLHRRLQTRLYRETTSYKAYASCFMPVYFI